MEKFIYDDINRQIEIVLSNGHCLRPSAVNLEYDTIFVHQISPLIVSIVCAHDSLDSVELAEFQHLSVNGQNISVRRSLANLDYWQYVLERLPSIISKYRAASRFEKNDPDDAFCSDMISYLNRAVDYMENKRKYPLRCPHCSVKLEISCGLYNGFDFGDDSIRGYRFFECDQCKGPVDKKAVLKSAITVLQNWSYVIESQLEYYDEGNKRNRYDDSSEEESGRSSSDNTSDGTSDNSSSDSTSDNSSSDSTSDNSSSDRASESDSRAHKKIRLGRINKKTRVSAARVYNLRSNRKE